MLPIPMGFSWDPWEFPYYAHLYSRETNRRSGVVLTVLTTSHKLTVLVLTLRRQGLGSRRRHKSRSFKEEEEAIIITDIDNILKTVGKRSCK